MYNIKLNKLILMGLIALLTSVSSVHAEQLAQISIGAMTVGGKVVPSRPCPKGFTSNCPADVPSSCSLQILAPNTFGSITITNNSGITALNITTDQTYLNSNNAFQTPSSGLSSLAPGASGILTYYGNGVPVSIDVQVKGTNTNPTCFSLLILPA